MLLDADESQLVLVDYQARLMPAIHDGSAVLANARLLACGAHAGRTGVGHRAKSVASGCQRCRLTRAVRPHAGKMHFSAAEEGLGEWLRPPAKPQQGGNARNLPKHLQKPAQQAPERGTIVIAGCEAHVCLLQTALDLMEDEFEVWVVTDACGSRTERNRDAAFDRLAGAGAELVTTEMVAFEWLRTCEHPTSRKCWAW